MIKPSPKLALKPKLEDLLIFRGLLAAVPTQEVGFRPFVGQEIEFMDGVGFVHDMVFMPNGRAIGVIPFGDGEVRGFRSIFYDPPRQ